MSGKDEGVFVPRRIIIIVILVSLCVNVFFLMMGILIGKDDLKWQADQEDKPQEQAEQVAQVFEAICERALVQAVPRATAPA